MVRQYRKFAGQIFFLKRQTNPVGRNTFSTGKLKVTLPWHQVWKVTKLVSKSTREDID